MEPNEARQAKSLRRLIGAMLASMLILASASALGDDNNGRWGGLPGGGPSGRPGGGEVQPPVGHRPGWHMLKPNEKVLAVGCQANPVGCLCPPDTTKITFWEGSGWGKLIQYKLMCVPVSCPTGQLLRKRVTTKTGEVNYKCEKPATS